MSEQFCKCTWTNWLCLFTLQVLSKFPVIQHFLFGSLLSIIPAVGPLKHTTLPGISHNPMVPPHDPGPCTGGHHQHMDSPHPFLPTPQDGASTQLPSLPSAHTRGIRPLSTADMMDAARPVAEPMIRVPGPAQQRLSGIDPSLINHPSTLRHPIMDPTVAEALKNPAPNLPSSMPPPKQLPPVPRMDDEAIKKASSGSYAKPGNEPESSQRKPSTLKPLGKDEKPSHSPSHYMETESQDETSKDHSSSDTLKNEDGAIASDKQAAPSGTGTKKLRD